MKTSAKVSNNFSLLLNPRKLFIMILFFGFTLLIYALSASGIKVKIRKKKFLSKKKIFFLFLDQINKDFTSLIENDTLIICKENHKDFRQFVNILSESSTQRFTQTSSQKENMPRIYFVTPVSFFSPNFFD